MVKIIRKGKKFGNHIVLYEGIKFDSKLECNCYKVIKKFCDNKNLILDLQKPFKINSINKKYIADFVVTCPYTGRFIVIDAKGVETSVFKLKKKLLYIQNIEVNCVKTPSSANKLLNKHF